MQASTLPQTTTTLTVTSTGNSVTTVSSGSLVLLKASVMAGGVPVTTGQVEFCDASAEHCSDIHLLGTAQLTSAGTAVHKFVPGIGSHSYKAVFMGRRSGVSALAGSSSGAATLTVTGKFPTTTSITSSGYVGGYSLTATVTGVVNAPTVVAPAGSISFLDTTNGNFPLAAATLSTATTGLSFLNSSNPPTVPEPNVVAAADFNGDGIPDLAVSNSNSGGVLLTILLGKGDGTFTAVATSPTVGLYPDSIVVADFNGDGNADLALTSVDQNIVTILLGNGDGTFTPAPNLDTVSTPQSVATGDFNGDGVADLAVVNDNSVLIFLGRGDGTFMAAAASPPTGFGPITVAVGDFNGDGVADLAVVNTCGASYPCNNAHGTVSIFIGKGDGTFTVVPASPVAGASPIGLVAADFNGDGILDLAVTNYGSIYINAVSIFLGNGDGTFKAAAPYQVPGIESNQMVVGDLNGDGIPDLVIGSHWSGTIKLLQGKGDGTFDTPLVVGIHAPLSSGYIAAADFDGDGIPDLAVPNQDVSGTVVVLLTQPTHTSTASVNGISPVGTGTHLVSAGNPGNDTYNASTSDTTSLTAQPLATALTLTAVPASSTYGQQVMLTASLSPYSGQNHSTNGEAITFYNGLLPLGTASLSSGVATLNLASLPIGTESLTASFAGETNFVASSSSALPYSVAKATPMIGFTAAPNPVAVQSPITLTATVSSSIGTPTGAVVFLDGNTTIGNVPLSNGVATLSVATLVAGSHSLTAAYNGDDYFIAVNSAPVSEVVQDFTLNPGGHSPSLTVQPGGTASFAIPVVPLGGTAFQTAVSFTASGLPAGAMAIFSPQTISAGSAATNVTLSIQVAKQTARQEPITINGRGAKMFALSILLLPFLDRRRRLSKLWGRYICSVILLLSGGVLFSGLTACGGGVASGGGSNSPTPQTYNVTVTAVSKAVSQTTTVTLIVQ